MKDHVYRFVKFGAVGGSIFILNLLAVNVAVTVMKIDPVVAYVAVAIVAIGISFMLNWRFTWQHSHANIWQCALRFAVSRIVTMIVLEAVVFKLLIEADLLMALSQICAVAIASVANYVLAHYWSFAADEPAAAVVSAQIPVRV